MAGRTRRGKGGEEREREREPRTSGERFARYET